MESLTEKQLFILNFIKSKVKLNGIVPSIREIGKASGLLSTSSVYLQLENLEKKGYIKRNQSKTRNIEILEKNFYSSDIVNVPIMGSISARLPNIEEAHIEGYFQLPAKYTKSNNTFILKVYGDSMINAGIIEDDLLIINKQNIANDKDIVIAILDKEITCKRLIIKNGIYILMPENEKYSPIIRQDIQILGKVIGIHRRY